MRWTDESGTRQISSPEGLLRVTGIAVVLLLLAATPFADPSEILLEEVVRCERTIAQWQAQAGWSRGLQIGVIVLGALIAALQKFEGRHLKVAIVAMGCAISIATGISPLVFPVEAARLKASVLDGRRLLFEMKTVLDALEHASGEDRQALHQEFGKRLEAFNAIERSLAVAAPALPAEAIAHAQDRLAIDARKDPALYATGRGEATALRQARALALENAVDRLAGQVQAADRAWARQPPVLLRALVTARAQEVASSPSYDQSRNLWDYTVELRISDVAASWKIAEALGSYTYVEGRTQLHEAGSEELTVSVKADDSSEGHFDFTFAVSPESEGGVAVEVLGVTTLAEGPADKSQWLFDVLVNDKRVLRLAGRPEDPGFLGGPADPEPRYRGVVSATELPLELRVQGARARSMPSAF
jgi:hypothetical protein